MFSIQILMNVRPIRVATEERVTISSMDSDVNVQLAILERNVRPVSSFYLFVCLFEALHPGQQFFIHFGTASWVLRVIY